MAGMYVVSAHKPSTVSVSVTAHFTHENELNLIIAYIIELNFSLLPVIFMIFIIFMLEKTIGLKYIR